MIHAPLSTTSVLDESAAVVRTTAARWAGLLLVTSLPWRMAQAMFADRVIALGSSAAQYGDALRESADAAFIAFLLALWGRAVYARACRLAASSGASPGREAFAVPAAAFVSYLFVASVAEAVTWLFAITIAGTAVGAAMSGLAIGTMELNDAPGVIAPLRRLARYGRESRVLIALIFVFFCALVVALVNVAALFNGGLWLASAIGGWDAPRWSMLLSGANRRFTLMVIAGALLVIEPFWIAANVVFVRKAGAAETGDDLRVWFEELQRS